MTPFDNFFVTKSLETKLTGAPRYELVNMKIISFFLLNYSMYVMICAKVTNLHSRPQASIYLRASLYNVSRQPFVASDLACVAVVGAAIYELVEEDEFRAVLHHFHSLWEELQITCCLP